jgi:ATP-dependent Clp protease ATP-binding subunit ClpB
LFDEIEKAHSEVFNVLLQILDDGRLTDNQGRVIDFRNTIIIMTSNIGSKFLVNGDRDAKNQVMEMVKQSFKPEFINRIDEIIIFNPLSKAVQEKIVDKLLNELNKRLLEQKIKIDFTKAVKESILNAAFDPEYGARPIKRYIQHHIESMIAREIIASNIIPNKDYVFDIIAGEFVIKEQK